MLPLILSTLAIGLLRAQEPVTAFTHVAVVPMDRERVLRNQTVLVQGEQIVALGPATRIQVPAGAVRIDGRGKYVIPGLGDMHAHVIHGGDTTAEILSLYVAAGVTTIREMTLQGDVKALARQISDSQWLPQIYAAADQNPDGTSSVATAAAAAQEVERVKAAGYDFLKINDTPSREIFDSTVAAARRVGLPYGGHMPGGALDGSDADPAKGLELAIAARYNSIEHIRDVTLGVLAAMGYRDIPWQDTAFVNQLSHRLDRKILRRVAQDMRRAGVWLCPTELLGESTTNFRTMPIRQQVIRSLHRARVGFLAGSDVGLRQPFLLVGFSVHQELAVLVDAGFTPYEALATATRNVAAFFGTLDSSGTVAVGKRADLVLLDGNPLRAIGYTAQVAGVMRNGRWLGRDTLDARLEALRLPDTYKERVRAEREWLRRERAALDAGSRIADMPTLVQYLRSRADP